MKKTKQFIPAPDPLDFPKFYKSGTKFTRVDSKSTFTEVHILKTVTNIRSGSNLHFVSDAMQYDTEIDKESFDSAFRNALSRIETALS